MRREARTISTYPLGLSLDGIYRNRYSVNVKVFEGGREVDAFRASIPDILRDSLRPIYKHLDPARQMVTFAGVEERWLPGGLMRTRREVALGNLNAALAFLAG